MKPWIIAVASAAITLLLVGVVRRAGEQPSLSSGGPATAASLEVESSEPRLSTGPSIVPIRAPSGLDPAIVALGRRLFEDRSLSRDGSVSCGSCHDIEQGGEDGRRFSVGVDGSEGSINAPTVLNAANNFAQFWNGRAATLEDQVAFPIHDAREMGTTWEVLLEKVRSDASYVAEFSRAFADGVTSGNVAVAIATYERSLVTPDSRFDRYLEGDDAAISAEEKRGYDTFRRVGCITCHNGVNAGSNSFQPFGVSASFAGAGQAVAKADLGRFNVTGEEADKFKFKVPTLRNVDRTAPYFHDGSVATLRDAVEIMARYQLGQKLRPQEVDDIVAFLKTLTAPPPP